MLLPRTPWVEQRPPFSGKVQACLDYFSGNWGPPGASQVAHHAPGCVRVSRRALPSLGRWVERPGSRRDSVVCPPSRLGQHWVRRDPLIAVCPAGLRLSPTAPLQGRSLRTISLRSWAPWRAGATLRSYAPLTGELSARRHWCAMIEPSPGNSVKGGWAHRNTGRKRLRPVTTLDDYNDERLAIACAVPPRAC